MAALYAAIGTIAHHEGMMQAPQSNTSNRAAFHTDERAYSPTAAQQMASNVPHTSSADASPVMYRFAINANVRKMAWNINRNMPSSIVAAQRGHVLPA